ncbi:MAG: DUF302 domain-containing protein [Deltaproteobacteria bacterium]|nr:DUF302 domain-containing protein [Deltaproteobacteria bacterium]
MRRSSTRRRRFRRTTDALKAEGLGVLTTIDVQDTLQKKLDANFRRFVIHGACSPVLAQRALTAELGVGLLPCSVTVFQGDGDSVVVQVVKPAAMFEVIQKPELEPVAREADERLKPPKSRSTSR